MKDVTLPVSITVDVCWHQGRIAVARHSGTELVVELWAPDLTDHHTEFTAPMTGNAGARVHSFEGVLWLAFRDASDRGHLMRLDTRQTHDLTPFFNAGRPFAFGDGHCAWQTSVSSANVVALGQPLHTARTVTFPDFIPTGLSHIANGEVFSWESQRLLRPFAVGFASRPPFVIGEDFDDRGLVGEIDGRQGHLLLWRENQMRDPRVDVNGDRAAVIAWATGGNARLGIVTAADLVTVAPPPPPPPTPDPRPTPPSAPDPPAETDTMDLPENVRLLLIQFAQRFPLPHTPGGGDEHENKCRAWCLRFAEQVRFSTADEAWGVKRAGEGRPQSKDTIAKNLGGGRLAIFDLMLGAGTGAPTLVERPYGEEASDQVFIPVQAVNHFGGPPPEPPAALTDAQKAVVNKLIAAALAPLKADVARLREEVEELKAGQT